MIPGPIPTKAAARAVGSCPIVTMLFAAPSIAWIV